jgi:hypothetical protein
MLIIKMWTKKTGDKVYYQYPVDSGTLDTYKNFEKRLSSPEECAEFCAGAVK